MKIMIVDDDRAWKEFCENILSNDYEIIHAWNGIEAVDKYKIEHPEIVIMDRKMPGLDGIEATQEILKIDSEAKVIGHSSIITDRRDFINAGAINYICKGPESARLGELIKEL